MPLLYILYSAARIIYFKHVLLPCPQNFTDSGKKKSQNLITTIFDSVISSSSSLQFTSPQICSSHSDLFASLKNSPISGPLYFLFSLLETLSSTQISAWFSSSSSLHLCSNISLSMDLSKTTISNYSPFSCSPCFFPGLFHSGNRKIIFLTFQNRVTEITSLSCYYGGLKCILAI